jgi:pimeloyl-ACP methyl ester carboxylesterase
MNDSDEQLSITLETHEGPLELAYRAEGQGEPLLLLHGFFGTCGDFQHLPGLTRGMRAIAPDLRGHGRSSNPSKRFRFHDAARDVLALLDRLGIARCRAVGLSGGALTLLRMVLLRSSLLESMVLVSACDGFPVEARAFMSAYSSEQAARDATPALRVLHVRGEPQITALFEAARQFAHGQHDTLVSAAELATVHTRTLLVSGDRDPLYPPEVAVRLLRNIPNAALWVVPESGHTPVFGDMSAEFVARARRFLAAG